MTTVEKDKATEQRVTAILNRARQEKAKGRYYIYEQYKSDLQDACGFGQEYDRAIRELACILKV